MLEVIFSLDWSVMNTMKQLRATLFSQLQSLRKVLFSLYLPIVLFFLVLGILSHWFDEFSLRIFLRDAVTLARLPFYAGLLPQLEGLIWSASLTICIFAYMALQPYQSDLARSRQFLLQAGFVTLMMLFDNVFLFHGTLAPNYLHIDKIVVLGVYAIVILYFAASNWAEIRSSEYLLCILTLGLLGTSFFLDMLPLEAFPDFQQIRFFLEDGSKFAGIATWLIYLARSALQRIGNIRQKNSVSELL